MAEPLMTLTDHERLVDAATEHLEVKIERLRDALRTIDEFDARGMYEEHARLEMRILAAAALGADDG